MTVFVIFDHTFIGKETAVCVIEYIQSGANMNKHYIQCFYNNLFHLKKYVHLLKVHYVVFWGRNH